MAFLEGSPWARRRNLQGQDAVVKLYQAWEPIVTQWYSRYPFPKIMVTDPQHDWQATWTRICESCGITNAAENPDLTQPGRARAQRHRGLRTAQSDGSAGHGQTRTDRVLGSPGAEG